MNEFRTILGVRLPADEAGRVDLSAVDRSRKSAGKSPSEWSRSRLCSDLIKRLETKTGQPRATLWKIVGRTKAARCWAHPTLAAAYLRELGFGPETTKPSPAS